MKAVDLYWKKNREWYYYDDNLVPRIREDAPEEAKKSYENYMKQKKQSIDQ